MATLFEEAKESFSVRVGQEVGRRAAERLLRGFAGEVWSSYLDAAGYPRESQLPASYHYPAATPLIQQQAQTTARADATPAAPATPVAPSPTPPSTPGGIKF